jgi:hypothetical protein
LLEVHLEIAMIMHMARAIVWGMSRVLGIQEAEPVVHRDLEHAHWDSSGRRWHTHAADRDGSMPNAA